MKNVALLKWAARMPQLPFKDAVMYSIFTIYCKSLLSGDDEVCVVIRIVRKEIKNFIQ